MVEVRDGTQHATQLLWRVQDGSAEVERVRALPERTARHHAHSCTYNATVQSSSIHFNDTTQYKRIKCVACFQNQLEQKVYMRWTPNDREALMRRLASAVPSLMRRSRGVRAAVCGSLSESKNRYWTTNRDKSFSEEDTGEKSSR